MYPIVRLIQCIIQSHAKPVVAIDTCVQTTLRCMPWDIDLYWELNNGRVLTLYDIGRTELAIRSGLTALLSQKKWGFVVAGSTIRYRKRIRLFQKITMKTQLVGVDHRWFYIRQSMWVKGTACNAVLLRVGVTQKGRSLMSSVVCDALTLDPSEMMLSGWERQWADQDSQRPWPPL